MRQLPDLQTILNAEIDRIENDDDPKLMMALSVGLVNSLRESNDEQQIDNLLRFSLSLPGEYAIMLVKDMQVNDIDVEGSEAWGEWVQKFAYLLA